MKNLLIILLLIASNVLAQNDTLKLASDVWPPFTNIESEKAIALDIVEEGLKLGNVTA